jgi:hypothetical protein
MAVADAMHDTNRSQRPEATHACAAPQPEHPREDPSMNAIHRDRGRRDRNHRMAIPVGVLLALVLGAGFDAAHAAGTDAPPPARIHVRADTSPADQSRLLPLRPAPLPAPPPAEPAPPPPPPPAPPMAPVPPVPPAMVANGQDVHDLSDIRLASPPVIPAATVPADANYQPEQGGYLVEHGTGFAMYHSPEVGATTRALLREQAAGTRAGPAQTIPGPAASAAYQRYLDSFTHPIPEKFEHAVEDSSGAGSH